jgi:hypothetical protein
VEVQCYGMCTSSYSEYRNTRPNSSLSKTGRLRSRSIWPVLPSLDDDHGCGGRRAQCGPDCAYSRVQLAAALNLPWISRLSVNARRRRGQTSGRNVPRWSRKCGRDDVPPIRTHAEAISIFVEITIQLRTRANIRIVSTSGVDQRQIINGGLAAFRHLSVLRLTKVAW